MLQWHQYLLGIILLVSGVLHFQKTKIYLRIMPSYIPAKTTMVYLSGIAEMVLGLALLNADTQQIAAWGIVVLFLLFFSVHIYMLQEKEARLGLPQWALWLRLLLQIGLLYWAYLYT